MKCLRVYADEKGESHFSEMEIAMSESQLVPGHTIQWSSPTAAAHIQFLTFPAWVSNAMRKLILASVVVIPMVAQAQPFDGHWYIYNYNTNQCTPAPMLPSQILLTLFEHDGKVYAEQLAGEGVGKPTAYVIGHYNSSGEHHVMIFKYFKECLAAPKGYQPRF